MAAMIWAMKDIDRRGLLAGLGSVALIRRAQSQPRPPIVGFVGFATEAVDRQTVAIFRQGLADLGYVEGRNITVEARSSDGDVRLGHKLLAEMIARPVDVFLSPGPAATRALVRMTKIPVVAIALPAAANQPELFKSFARPGGSVTGFSAFGEEMSAKRIEMLKEAVPDLKVIGVLSNITDPTFRDWGEQTMKDAVKQGLTPVRLGLEGAERAAVAMHLSELRRAGGNAVIVIRDYLTSALVQDICELAISEKISVVGEHAQFAKAGALFSYGADIGDLFRRAAGYVDRILKGESAAELPIQLPTKFELSINQRTARILGINMPPTLLVLANDVIE
jgi:putative ABC transport system substrate-binding protein